CPQVKMTWKCDLDFVSRLAEACKKEDFPLLLIDRELSRRYGIKPDIDHGTFVPLYFIEKTGLNVPLVLLGYSDADREEYARLGRIVREVLEDDDVPTAVIASGDMSHRLLASGPYGFNAKGPVFDEIMEEALRTCSLEVLSQKLDAVTVSEAGQCGLNSVSWLLGSLDGDVNINFLSHEGPYGVGYIVSCCLPAGCEVDLCCEGCEFDGERQDEDEHPDMPENKKERSGRVRKESAGGVEAEDEKMEAHVLLAKRSTEFFVKTGGFLSFDLEQYPELKTPAAVFVTLKKDGDLRGCIGTLAPVCSNQAEEVVRNAILACSRDPRFPPVTEDELPFLHYHVSVLGEPVKVAGYQDLDPVKYGVIVSKGERRGVLLPNLEGITTVERQVAIACRKAGIRPEEKPELFRFETVGYGE
ncbi:AmmeMemoRadiSam system protein A, partial [bacterium]|nr:AmmeMemoRadiSam system protein A [bacterium]